MPSNPNWGAYRLNSDEVIRILGGKCVACGTTENLEVDHKDSKKKSFEVRRMLTTYSPQEIIEEIKKCQLLCRACHLEKSILERGQKPARGTHGTLSSYRYCKCELCRAANAKYHAARRKRNETSER